MTKTDIPAALVTIITTIIRDVNNMEPLQRNATVGRLVT